MKILFLLLFSIIFSPTLKADVALDEEQRIVWVNTLKELMLEIEQKTPYEVTSLELEFKRHFGFINNAWAANDECLFAGWPSQVRTSGGKKFCTSPLNLASGYQAGSCQNGELQCQPALFGKNICVRFNSASEKARAFSKCEEKFKEEKRDHSFLKNMSAQEANDLQNLSVLAHKVCEEGSVGIQKGSGMCKNLMNKFDDGMRSIARSQRTIASVPDVHAPAREKNPENIRSIERERAIPSHTHDEECPAEHLQILKRSVVSNIESARDAGVTQVYENLKKNFLNSPHCKAENVLHDPSIPNSLLTKDLIYDLSFLDYTSSNDDRAQKRLDDVLVKYKTSSSTRSQILNIFSKPGDLTKARQEIKRLALQDYSVNAKTRNTELRGILEESLVKNNIFSKKDGKPECPFMSKDSFIKAFEGMQKVKSKAGVKNKNLLTIVDYTQPSNSRRLYVIDLSNNKIMHNTWVAHGGGEGNVFGSDGIGGSPGMSNRSGSNQSSDGFVVAGAPSFGSRFGNNLILNGVDRNNSNMRGRAVIMHGWDSPGEEFVNGLSRYKGEAPIDVRRSLKNLSGQTSKAEFDKTISDIKSATFVDKILRPTEGCLGVPRVNMPHLDPKGRNQSMINVLRQDLSGTVIFNYSGQNMKSNYF